MVASSSGAEVRVTMRGKASFRSATRQYGSIGHISSGGIGARESGESHRGGAMPSAEWRVLRPRGIMPSADRYSGDNNLPIKGGIRMPHVIDALAVMLYHVQQRRRQMAKHYSCWKIAGSSRR